MSSRLSNEFIRLCRRLEELRKHLLPPSFSNTGSYSNDEYDRVRGYVALVHAELEAYLEDRCLTVADARVSSWLRTRCPSPVIIALHAMCYSGWAEFLDQSSFSPPQKKPTNQLSIEARLQDALVQYRKIVESNHGIKEDNLKRLLIPLSIRMNELDPAWLLTMDTFGVTRGQIVHLSSSAMTHQPDPKNYRDLLWRQIIPGIRDLDVILSSLLI